MSGRFSTVAAFQSAFTETTTGPSSMKAKKVISTFLPVVLWAILAAVRCSMDVTGGGSEAGNARVVGKITDEEGRPVVNVVVRLLPSDFNPATDSASGESSFDTTDEEGRYRFSVAEEGRYSLLAVQMESRLRGFIAEVFLGATNDTVADCTLKKPGTVQVLLADSLAAGSGYLYIPGTTVFSRIRPFGEYSVLDSVPAGVIPTIALSSDGKKDPVAIQTNVEVPSGDTVTIPWQGWTSSRKIVLNTSASGADVQEDVTGFPVLIRFSEGTFDFSQAKNAGEDIRFTTRNGRLLPHEIEKWDGFGGSAAVWVKVDTIRGNDSTQWVVMYWGNPDAVDVSDGGAVFDTATGFQGVWHLGGDAADSVTDVTDNGNHGVSPDTARPEVGTGVAGDCRTFDGISDFISMPNTADGSLNFPEKGYYTVSAWVFADEFDGASRLIVAKGYEQYFLRLTYFPTNAPLWEFSEFGADDSWQACTTTAYSGEWALVTGVRAGGMQMLYVNGVPVDSTPAVIPSTDLARNTSYDLSIGKFLDPVNQPTDTVGYCYFKGAIDEVRIIGEARGSAWIRMCYMNQRSDDCLVRFK
ncbi:MAG: DUF2341 domain-containing protein [Chitinispirillaceae bacterium]|nr:DUF2341 domain-containing protein [Chitinispirillaceae bacterium]